MDSAMWQSWVNENIQRGCNKIELGYILLRNKFTLPQVRTMMGEHFPADLEPAKGEPKIIPMGNPLDRKCASLVEVQQQLSQLSPKDGTIERRRGVSSDEFLEKYYSANRPVILCDLMAYWQAKKKWTPKYLKEICGKETIEIMAERNSNADYETNVDPRRKEITFAEYVDMVTKGGETNDYYITARNNFFTRPGVKPLLKDIEIFTEYLKETDGQGIYMWYGPKGTVTPLHHDTMNILLAQVQGHKQFKLISANSVGSVYNNFAVYSQVDAANPDYTKFPKFRDVTVIDFELAPGEVLFLPVGWWHWVKSLDTCISVSFTNFLFHNSFKWNQPGEAGQQDY